MTRQEAAYAATYFLVMSFFFAAMSILPLLFGDGETAVMWLMLAIWMDVVSSTICIAYCRPALVKVRVRR